MVVINCGNRTGRSEGKRVFRLPIVIRRQIIGAEQQEAARMACKYQEEA